MTDTTRSEAARLLNRIKVWREISDENDPLATILNEFERYVHAQSASVQAEPTEAQVKAAYDYLQKHGVSLSTMGGALKAAAIPAPGQTASVGEDAVERVSRAITEVQLWSRWNVHTDDRDPENPIEICRYGKSGEPEIVVIKRFPACYGENSALSEMVRHERALAAIQAARMPAPVPEWNADMEAAPVDTVLLLFTPMAGWDHNLPRGQWDIGYKEQSLGPDTPWNWRYAWGEYRGRVIQGSQPTRWMLGPLPPRATGETGK